MLSKKGVSGDIKQPIGQYWGTQGGEGEEPKWQKVRFAEMELRRCDMRETQQGKRVGRHNPSRKISGESVLSALAHQPTLIHLSYMTCGLRI